MGKNLSQSKQPGLQKNEKYKPYIKWNKETDEWILKEEDENDGWIEAKSRKNYWKKRNDKGKK